MELAFIDLLCALITVLQNFVNAVPCFSMSVVKARTHLSSTLEKVNICNVTKRKQHNCAGGWCSL